VIRHQESPVVYYAFASFPSVGMVHGVFARHGGVSQGDFATLNVGSSVGDDAAHVAINQQRVYQALGLEAKTVVTARQVHGVHVAVAAPDDGGKVLAETDALISNTPGLALLLRFADCVPVFLYAPRQGAIGLAHAGWQGTLAGVAARTALELGTTYGCRTEELLAGIGPAIGPCCFEVGAEVLDRLQAVPWRERVLDSRPSGGGKAHLDLWQANAQQLRAVGVKHIEIAGLCTRCHRDEFYSHRGDHGHTGRLAAVIGLPARQPAIAEAPQGGA
jgi:polyphenol oxidase